MLRNRCGVPRGHEDPIARPGDERLLADPELELAGEDLEALLLGGVQMRRGDRPVGLDERLDDDALAVRVGGRRPEDERLAGDRVRQRLSVGDHVVPPVRVDW